jgi:hypothetical protein
MGLLLGVVLAELRLTDLLELATVAVQVLFVVAHDLEFATLELLLLVKGASTAAAVVDSDPAYHRLLLLLDLRSLGDLGDLRAHEKQGLVRDRGVRDRNNATKNFLDDFLLDKVGMATIHDKSHFLDGEEIGLNQLLCLSSDNGLEVKLGLGEKSVHEDGEGHFVRCTNLVKSVRPVFNLGLVYPFRTPSF